MKAIGEEENPSAWMQYRGFGNRGVDGDGVIYRHNGVDGVVCPFCATFIPLQADTCTGCGAIRAMMSDRKALKLGLKFLMWCAIIFVVSILVMLIIYGFPN